MSLGLNGGKRDGVEPLGGPFEPASRLESAGMSWSGMSGARRRKTTDRLTRTNFDRTALESSLRRDTLDVKSEVRPRSLQCISRAPNTDRSVILTENIKVTHAKTEIIIRATHTQDVLGEKGRRIRELTGV